MIEIAKFYNNVKGKDAQDHSQWSKVKYTIQERTTPLPHSPSGLPTVSSVIDSSPVNTPINLPEQVVLIPYSPLSASFAHASAQPYSRQNLAEETKIEVITM